MNLVKKNCLRALGLIAMCSACAQVLTATPASPPLSLQVRIWNTESSSFFPEREDPVLRVPWLDDSRPVGIALSGGGTRAAAAALGQLRVLRMLGWMPYVGYISSVSGGSWTAVPYTYLPGDVHREEIFMGKFHCPENLNESNLKLQPKGSMTRAINHAWVAWKSFFQILLLRGDESFSGGLGNTFLRPFGLEDRSKFFSFHQEALNAALAANPHLRADDFFLARVGRPYLIVGATLIAQPGPRHRDELFPVEITPLYTGIQRRFSARNGHPVGGGYVESFGYDSRIKPNKLPGDGARISSLKVLLGRKRYRFTLSDVIGASGSAPQSFVNKLYLDLIGFPEFRTWPIRRDKKEKEYSYGDGGHIDNIGLFPLLSRHTPKIIVFINSSATFNVEKNPLNEYPLYGDLIHYFRNPRPGGPPAAEEKARTAEDFAKVSAPDPSRVVIANGEARLQQLFTAFVNDRRQGRPLVYCDNYKIVNNRRFGVTPYEASICWVYLDTAKRWLDKLDKNDKLLQTVTGGNFPQFSTFFDSSLEVIRLTPAETNALSNFTAWSVLESRKEIERVLGLPSTPVAEQCQL
ncbi:MAG TPA: hypothetical protein VKM72_06610 [Thermoanaerobaculia bacterium]|nr:hypothetical protein [Thermoanaerobaculia bacterium]